MLRERFLLDRRWMVNALIRLGSIQFDRPIALAPMAGISDRPFRELCREHGADYTVAEMIGSDPAFRRTEKTQRRLERGSGIHIVQIAGADPDALADAARYCEAQGADVIDINMGCPAKKVCNQLAGSALMRDEPLVARLLRAVVGAVAVPVTLKMRTGWAPHRRNAPRIARIAEDLGVRLVTVHGRTRECAFRGAAEYDTIAAVKHAVSIPVIANGDIDSPATAARVLRETHCDGLMVGRAAYGNPWLFGAIRAAITGTGDVEGPAPDTVLATIAVHVRAIHEFYGERMGTRVARKHVGWYSRLLAHGETLRREFNRIEHAEAQLALIHHYENKLQGVLAA